MLHIGSIKDDSKAASDRDQDWKCGLVTEFVKY